MNIKKILISQPKPTTDKFFELADRFGVELVFRPFIKVEGLTAKEFRQSRINLSEFTAVIFTAKTAIDHFFRLCKEMRISIPDTMKYFCTTESIACYLQKYIQYRKRKIFHGESGKIDDLMPFFQRNKNEKFLYAVSDVHKDGVSNILDQIGINYTKAVMYRTVSNDFGPDEPFDYDMLIFFSPSGIDALLKNFPDFKQDDIKIGCLGESTAKAVVDAGFRLDLQAGTPQAPSILGALEQFLERESGEA